MDYIAIGGLLVDVLDSFDISLFGSWYLIILKVSTAYAIETK